MSDAYNFLNDKAAMTFVQEHPDGATCAQIAEATGHTEEEIRDTLREALGKLRWRERAPHISYTGPRAPRDDDAHAEAFKLRCLARDAEAAAAVAAMEDSGLTARLRPLIAELEAQASRVGLLVEYTEEVSARL